MGRIIVGAIGFIAFFAPAFRGIFNVGTITGAVFFGIMLLSGIFNNRIKPYISKALNSKAWGFLKYAVVAIVLIASLTVSVETGCIVKSVYNSPRSEDVTLVILGCKVNGTRPSLMLRGRIDAAAEYLNNHPNAKCVLSGGQGEDEEISEAQCMFNELTRYGIDTDRLFLEDKSTSTKENIEYSLQVIEKNGLSKNIAVVTNEFHEYRASLVAKEYGIACTSVPAKTAYWLLPTYLVREWYAIIFETFFR